MAIKIPTNFDFHTIPLDINETYCRDKLNLDIGNWARFRYAIKVGNSAGNLKPIKGKVSADVQEAYRELGKTHYEVILSLGSARLAFDQASQFMLVNSLLFKKSCKDFYFHIGCLLDNIARLIYIINIPNSATLLNNRNKLQRHWIDWGTLPSVRGYSRLKYSKHLKEIINIRNSFTHGWSCTFTINNRGEQYWPVAIRKNRDYFWPYDEASILKRKYVKWVPILIMMNDDFNFIERFQNNIFKKLIRDITNFEKNYQLVIV